MHFFRIFSLLLIRPSLIIELRHTGEKLPYKCLFVPSIFFTNINLQIHIRTHIGEKQYEFIQCGKEFSLKSHLTSHMGMQSRKKAQNRKKMIAHKYYTESDEFFLHSTVDISPPSVIYCSSQDIKQVLTLFILIFWKNYTIVRALKFYICHYFQKE